MTRRYPEFGAAVVEAEPASPPSRRCRFGTLDIVYDERVLQPRPWTLEQSRWAAELAADACPGPLLELCAGVGHIGLAAAVLADRDLIQVEVDPVAARYAEANAAGAGWTGRVEVRAASVEQALRPGERFPVVIADPPYIRTADLCRFPEDPRLAVDGGVDGLAGVRACLAVAARHLVVGGVCVLQVAGPGQAAAIDKWMADGRTGLSLEETRVVDAERAVVLLRQTGSEAQVPG